MVSNIVLQTPQCMIGIPGLIAAVVVLGGNHHTSCLVSSARHPETVPGWRLVVSCYADSNPTYSQSASSNNAVDGLPNRVNQTRIDVKQGTWTPKRRTAIDAGLVVDKFRVLLSNVNPLMAALVRCKELTSMSFTEPFQLVSNRVI